MATVITINSQGNPVKVITKNNKAMNNKTILESWAEGVIVLKSGTSIEIIEVPIEGPDG